MTKKLIQSQAFQLFESQLFALYKDFNSKKHRERAKAKYEAFLVSCSEQFLQHARALYSLIDLDEFTNYSAKTGANTTPFQNLSQLIDYTNHLSFFASSLIVQQKKSSHRLFAYESLIYLMAYCFENGDYISAVSLYCGISKSHIEHLFKDNALSTAATLTLATYGQYCNDMIYPGKSLSLSEEKGSEHAFHILPYPASLLMQLDKAKEVFKQGQQEFSAIAEEKLLLDKELKKLRTRSNRLVRRLTQESKLSTNKKDKSLSFTKKTKAKDYENYKQLKSQVAELSSQYHALIIRYQQLIKTTGNNGFPNKLIDHLAAKKTLGFLVMTMTLNRMEQDRHPISAYGNTQAMLESVAESQLDDVLIRAYTLRYCKKTIGARTITHILEETFATEPLDPGVNARDTSHQILQLDAVKEVMDRIEPQCQRLDFSELPRFKILQVAPLQEAIKTRLSTRYGLRASLFSSSSEQSSDSVEPDLSYEQQETLLSNY